MEFASLDSCNFVTVSAIFEGCLHGAGNYRRPGKKFLPSKNFVLLMLPVLILMF
jgi:hypothetical protein